MIYIHIKTGLIISAFEEDGGWVSFVPELSGCVSQGDTEAEALENLDDAIGLVLEVMEEDGLPDPLEFISVTGGCCHMGDVS